MIMNDHLQGSARVLKSVGNVLLVGLLALALQVMPAAAAPFAYVTNVYSSNVSVIATATNTVVATIPLESLPQCSPSFFPGCVPFGVAITPDGAFAYVTNAADGTVSVIATATNTVVATIPIGVGVSPIGVAIMPDGAFAYVTGSGNVFVIATATNAVVATIPIFPVGSQPYGVAITPDGAFAYVAVGTFSGGSVTNGLVEVIATATNTVVATIGVGVSPTQVAITPAAKPGNKCPLTQGFWQNHPKAWPVTSLTLGSQTYTQAQLLTILTTTARGDVSLILADQLIATKLNIAHGSNPATVSTTITDADNLLSQFGTNRLPYNVRTSSAIGQQMVNDANVLDRYNNGDLTPNCTP